MSRSLPGTFKYSLRQRERALHVAPFGRVLDPGGFDELVEWRREVAKPPSHFVRGVSVRQWCRVYGVWDLSLSTDWNIYVQVCWFRPPSEMKAPLVDSILARGRHLRPFRQAKTDSLSLPTTPTTFTPSEYDLNLNEWTGLGMPTPPPPTFPRLLLLLLALSWASAASSSANSHRVASPHSPQTTQETPRRTRYDPPQVPHLPDSIREFRFNAPAPPISPLPPAAKLDDGAPAEDDEDRYVEPTVDDLVLSPLVLAVTVDGQVHALKRQTGQWMWTLHDDGGAALGGSSDDERRRRERAGGAVGEPLVKAVGRKKAAAAAAALSNSNSNPALVQPTSLATDLVETAVDEDEDEDEVYVIEPSAEGDIYLYTRDSGILQKLPLSMQQLVGRSPFTFPSDLSRAFIGRKETKLVGVDLRTGRLVGVFGSGVGAGWCEWDEARPGRKRSQEACDEEISRRPEDLLYMSRSGACAFVLAGAVWGNELTRCAPARVPPFNLQQDVRDPAADTLVHDLLIFVVRRAAAGAVDAHPRWAVPPADARRVAPLLPDRRRRPPVDNRVRPPSRERVRHCDPALGRPRAGGARPAAHV